MAKAVFCIASSESQAEKMVSDLKRHSFRDSDISVLFPDKTGAKDFAHEMQTKAPEGALTGVIALGVVAGCLGWMLGSGALPAQSSALGLFAAAGPLVAALSVGAVGAAVGGVVGSLVGLGFPEIVAKRYQGKIRAGNILISVHAETLSQARQAKRIFFDAGCHDASITAEAVVPNKRLCPS
jgi:hypothetical protein